MGGRILKADMTQCSRIQQSALHAVLLVSCALLSSCVLAQTTDGSSILADDASQITPGKSTRADVTRILGPPDEIVHSNREHDPLLEKVYMYRRSKKKQTALFLLVFSTFRSDTKWDHVAVFFDSKGVVEHVGVKLDSESAAYGAPW